MWMLYLLFLRIYVFVFAIGCATASADRLFKGLNTPVTTPCPALAPCQGSPALRMRCDVTPPADSQRGLIWSQPTRPRSGSALSFVFTSESFATSGLPNVYRGYLTTFLN